MDGRGALCRRATTMSRAGVVASQADNLFRCRTEPASVVHVGLLSNRMMVPGLAAEGGVLLPSMGVPPLRATFGPAWPEGRGRAVLLVHAPVLLLLEEARKWVARRGGR